ncbi:hypothetical protein FKM82_019595 [Ascaphus truei]
MHSVFDCNIHFSTCGGKKGSGLSICPSIILALHVYSLLSLPPTASGLQGEESILGGNEECADFRPQNVCSFCVLGCASPKGVLSV